MLERMSIEQGGIVRAHPDINPIVVCDTILVVDDNPTNLSVLCDVLSLQDYRVAVAQSGEDALDCVEEVFPDLILLDVMMPGISGFETCVRLKENPKTQHIPILFMTALSETVNKVHGLSLGAVDYITKPFIQEETLARIKVHLDLKKAQARLIQSEKMASLGQLVAGIAHEINNPVSFIHGNLDPAKNYAESLLSFASLCQQQAVLPTVVSDYAQEIELEFIQQDFLLLLDSMQLGTERIRSVVESLRTFSCLDESDYKEVDLHPGLNSSLVMLQRRLQAQSFRPCINVIKAYQSLPLLGCYPRKLNDVFLILMTNAIDAIDQRFAQFQSSKPASSDDPASSVPVKDRVSDGQTSRRQKTTELPALTIETLLEDQQIIVQVIDNGIGISKDIQGRVFDQFFTTKPIGQNAGLGLAMASAIVMKEHGGSLTFHSEVNRGTVFRVALPLNHS